MTRGPIGRRAGRTGGEGRAGCSARSTPPRGGRRAARSARPRRHRSRRSRRGHVGGRPWVGREPVAPRDGAVGRPVGVPQTREQHLHAGAARPPPRCCRTRARHTPDRPGPARVAGRVAATRSHRRSTRTTRAPSRPSSSRGARGHAGQGQAVVLQARERGPGRGRRGPGRRRSPRHSPPRWRRSERCREGDADGQRRAESRRRAPRRGCAAWADFGQGRGGSEDRRNRGGRIWPAARRTFYTVTPAPVRRRAIA